MSPVGNFLLYYTKVTSLTHVIDKVGLGFVGRRRGDNISIAVVGAERLGVAPPLAGRGAAICLRRHHVSQGVVQIPVQQTALVLGRRRCTAVTICGVRHGENAALLLDHVFVR